MNRAGFLKTLAADSELLVDTARRDIDARVPSCEGWTVRDAVEHVAGVYEHQIAAINLAGPKPDPWPPEWPADRDPLVWFADARLRLVETLTTVDSDAPAWTWLPTDQTAGFWIRRMAQETAVHRVDIQLATGNPTPVDEDLAVDGIDEVLVLMLDDDWDEFPQPGLTGAVMVATGDRSWRVTMTADAVVVSSSDGTSADAVVEGDPSPLLLWLWGRAPGSVVRIAGDAEAAERLRRRLAIATQ